MMALNIFSSYRSKSKHTAIVVWNSRFVWRDSDLREAMDNVRIDLVAMGGMRGVAVRDDGHLSIFRALNRTEVADHWVDMLEKEGAQRLNSWGIEWATSWGNIEHTGFWDKARELLAREPGRKYIWKYPLAKASLAGNLVPFQACPRGILLDVLADRATGLRPQIEDGVVHPDVLQWFVDEGLVDAQVLAEQITPENFPLDCSRKRFMGILDSMQCETGYVQSMCRGVLENYGLTYEQRLRFVGQAMVSFGSEMWSKLAPAFEGHLDGIELNVLQAVCGFSPYSRDAQEMELFNTLYKGTQASMFRFRQDCANEGMRNGPGQHEGLLFLMELAPPADRIDLYHLGVRALNVQRGLVPAPDVLPLPSLE